MAKYITVQGLYIHIPFCEKKCFYCDFLSHDHLYDKWVDRYINALCTEIKRSSAKFRIADQVSIYFGGGTPSLLTKEHFQKIFEVLDEYGYLEASVETTVEVNPSSVNVEKLSALNSLGVNRLSIGVQSFSDKVLKAIGRVHSSTQAVEAVRMARQSGFKNISVDLMYGLPEQSIQDLAKSIDGALDLAVEHISVYGLKVENRTPLSKMLERGEITLPSEELDEEMYDYIVNRLPRENYHRYEISNYALPQYQSRHNLMYWQYKNYLSVGIGASSQYSPYRMTNTKFIEKYVTSLEKRQPIPREVEYIKREDAMAEYCFLALRTSYGLDTLTFAQFFNIDIKHIYGEVIRENLQEEFLYYNEFGNLSLTKKGAKFANVVFGSFLP